MKTQTTLAYAAALTAVLLAACGGEPMNLENSKDKADLNAEEGDVCEVACVAPWVTKDKVNVFSYKGGGEFKETDYELPQGTDLTISITKTAGFWMNETWYKVDEVQNHWLPKEDVIRDYNRCATIPIRDAVAECHTGSLSQTNGELIAYASAGTKVVVKKWIKATRCPAPGWRWNEIQVESPGLDLIGYVPHDYITCARDIPVLGPEPDSPPTSAR